MRTKFYIDEVKLFERVLMLQDLVGEQALHKEPCPLLADQLVELDVLCHKLLQDVGKLREMVYKALDRVDV